ncbi:dihydroxyacetone kinase phosphoryl donor subunit DhaM [Heyndrickxia coagulans]|jgi:PTS hybrid protein|uniref:phosphoenolpyruvate--glycerone phosphotransferase n=2 Tax=Heyndrickxia coagulans TaxID=1398 RepID=A0A150K324_HEYCO|nr:MULTISPECIES: dihydroxyacetone kinase phosphoryl donor subunit DhaM [Heyndrickxia]AEP01091.1 dihydroxyacetone kinase, phosphotransfer subunit [Heyndrickxia coagulans 36D1]APB37256.1 PTS-dependent dihydroxyacetone kinase phosphotransferase subunit DhaM [Heyndrickxia coagulans]AWP38186.1 PTS-dependent dihydroxyacetone kinase phosphotransferase subunit DhaM [Heyndrickxia coagulans]KGT39568.1 PTS system mannnose-specific family transporter subunit IIA [Heyndrickxia coagulans P38]KYC63907.1 Phos
MSKKPVGIVIVSHIPEIAAGLATLLKEAAKDVSITYAGGTDDGGVGTSFDKMNAAIAENEADDLFAFYDLGSAKMNLEMAMEMSDKYIRLMDTAFVESAYTAAALIQADAELEEILKQLEPLKVK